jgi:tyrosinase
MKDADTMVPVTVSGVVPLTAALEKAHNDGRMQDLDTTTVSAYLCQNLHWKIRKGDGTVVDPLQVPDFSIAVVSSEVQPAKSLTEFPKWVGGLIVHTDVTRGRPGGVCNEDEV